MGYQKSKHKYQTKKLMTTVKNSVPMLGVLLGMGCEPKENVIIFTNPKGSSYDIGMDKGKSAVQDQLIDAVFFSNPKGSTYDMYIDQADAQKIDQAQGDSQVISQDATIAISDQAFVDQSTIVDASVSAVDQSMGAKKNDK